MNRHNSFLVVCCILTYIFVGTDCLEKIVSPTEFERRIVSSPSPEFWDGWTAEEQALLTSINLDDSTEAEQGDHNARFFDDLHHPIQPQQDYHYHNHDNHYDHQDNARVIPNLDGTAHKLNPTLENHVGRNPTGESGWGEPTRPLAPAHSFASIASSSHFASHGEPVMHFARASDKGAGQLQSPNAVFEHHAIDPKQLKYLESSIQLYPPNSVYLDDPNRYTPYNFAAENHQTLQTSHQSSSTGSPPFDVSDSPIIPNMEMEDSQDNFWRVILHNKPQSGGGLPTSSSQTPVPESRVTQPSFQTYGSQPEYPSPLGRQSIPLPWTQAPPNTVSSFDGHPHKMRAQSSVSSNIYVPSPTLNSHSAPSEAIELSNLERQLMIDESAQSPFRSVVDQEMRMLPRRRVDFHGQNIADFTQPFSQIEPSQLNYPSQLNRQSTPPSWTYPLPVTNPSFHGHPQNLMAQPSVGPDMHDPSQRLISQSRHRESLDLMNVEKLLMEDDDEEASLTNLFESEIGVLSEHQVDLHRQKPADFTKPFSGAHAPQIERQAELSRQSRLHSRTHTSPRTNLFYEHPQNVMVQSSVGSSFHVSSQRPRSSSSQTGSVEVIDLDSGWREEGSAQSPLRSWVEPEINMLARHQVGPNDQKPAPASQPFSQTDTSQLKYASQLDRQSTPLSWTQRALPTTIPSFGRHHQNRRAQSRFMSSNHGHSEGQEHQTVSSLSTSLEVIDLEKDSMEEDSAQSMSIVHPEVSIVPKSPLDFRNQKPVQNGYDRELQIKNNIPVIHQKDIIPERVNNYEPKIQMKHIYEVEADQLPEIQTEYPVNAQFSHIPKKRRQALEIQTSFKTVESASTQALASTKSSFKKSDQADLQTEHMHEESDSPHPESFGSGYSQDSVGLAQSENLPKTDPQSSTGLQVRGTAYEKWQRLHEHSVRDSRNPEFKAKDSRKRKRSKPSGEISRLLAIKIKAMTNKVFPQLIEDNFVIFPGSSRLRQITRRNGQVSINPTTHLGLLSPELEDEMLDSMRTNYSPYVYNLLEKIENLFRSESHPLQLFEQLKISKTEYSNDYLGFIQRAKSLMSGHHKRNVFYLADVEERHEFSRFDKSERNEKGFGHVHHLDYSFHVGIMAVLQESLSNKFFAKSLYTNEVNELLGGFYERLIGRFSNNNEVFEIKGAVYEVTKKMTNLMACYMIIFTYIVDLFLIPAEKSQERIEKLKTIAWKFLARHWLTIEMDLDFQKKIERIHNPISANVWIWDLLESFIKKLPQSFPDRLGLCITSNEISEPSLKRSVNKFCGLTVLSVSAIYKQ